ncbi:SusD/RagB family nutrient-binding outer membrane lipoprotein [Limibacter armeniacum]|uniref:SusD/RagB family nutrient-binding outer membrane lipoprotein n=1 Tax=Limibacter armeniacum TaxID=466084 RepID=UPI002FE62A75
MKFKFNKFILSAAIAASVLSSCTNDFDEINENPYTSNSLDEKHQFTYSQLKMFASGHEGWRGNLIMSSSYAMTSTNAYTTGVGFGTSDSYTEATWSLIMGDVAKNITDVNTKLEEENTDNHNDAKLAQSTVVKVVNFLRLTSLYGDIPYSEAGKGYSEKVFYPKYDAQKDVLYAMVDELKEARSKFADANLELFNYDLYYEGNASNWAKLTNSLLMRIGLMMSAADPGKGQEVFAEAYNDSNGYIQSLNESCMVEHTENGGAWGQHINGAGVAMQGRVGGFSYTFMSDTTLRLMQEKQDPRIFWVCGQLDYSSGTATVITDIPNFDPFAMAESSASEPFKPVHYRGMKYGNRGDASRGLFKVGDGIKQLGFHTTTNEGVLTTTNGREYKKDGQFALLTGLNPETILNATSPSTVMGADEVQFMIAEAINRGWIGGDASAAFEDGVRKAIMKYPSLYPGQTTVDKLIAAYNTHLTDEGEPVYNWSASVENYIQDQVAEFGTASQDAQLEMIVYQHWMSQIGNGQRAFALWNRTHLPSFVKAKLTEEDMSVQLPVYEIPAGLSEEEQKAFDPLTEYASTGDASIFTTSNFEKVELHTGGNTAGVRPTRFPYPNRELTVNAANANEAMQRQGSTGGDDSFISIPQWFSHK